MITFDKVLKLNIGRSKISVMALSPVESLLVLAYSKVVLIVNPVNWEVLQELNAKSKVEAIQFSLDEKKLFIACSNGSILVYDIANRAKLMSLQSKLGGYRSLACSPDNIFLAGGHYEPDVSIFSLSEEKLVASLSPNVFDDEGKTDLAFLEKETKLLSTAYNNICVWELLDIKSSQTPLLQFGIDEHCHITNIALSPNDNFVACLIEYEDRVEVGIWELNSAKLLNISEVSLFTFQIFWNSNEEIILFDKEMGVAFWQPFHSDFDFSYFLDKSIKEILSVTISPLKRLVLISGKGGGIYRVHTSVEDVILA